MKKYLTIELSDGSTWGFPASIIATDRANYYKDDPDSSFKEEYDYTMENKFELSDWFFNNMNSDQKELIGSWTKIKEAPDVSFADMLSDALCDDPNFDIVEIK